MVFQWEEGHFHRWTVQKNMHEPFATLPSKRSYPSKSSWPIYQLVPHIQFLTVFWPCFPLLINKKDIPRYFANFISYRLSMNWTSSPSRKGPVIFVPLFAGAWYVVPSWCRSQQTKSSVIPRLQPAKHEDNLWDIEGWKMMGPAFSHELSFPSTIKYSNKEQWYFLLISQVGLPKPG